MQTDRRVIPVLVLAVLVSAWSAPLVRLSGAPPMAIAAWRLTIATVILLPVFLLSGGPAEWRRLERRHLLVAAGSGAALAVHFAAWIASLRLTSVAASSVLVATSPIFGWVLSWRFLGERPALRQAAGIFVAVAGAAVIALGDAGSAGGNALLGDALSLLGAVMGAIYLVIGRHLRGKVSLVGYITPVYGAAALILLAWAALRGEAFVPYPARDWAVFGALAAGPMLLGHTGQNFALRRLPAWAVGAAMLGEPIGSTIIAWLLPAIAEPPGAWAVAGGALCLAGIALTLAAARPARAD